MLHQVLRSKHWVPQDDSLLEKLFWEFDSLRCNRASESEKAEFKKILSKYADYMTYVVSQGLLTVENGDCLDVNGKKNNCKKCILQVNCENM